MSEFIRWPLDSAKPIELPDRVKMANRNDLRSSLRAADKRRQRRVEAFAAASSPVTAADHAAGVQTSNVDAVEAIVQSALVYCLSEGCRLDAVLVGGLRGFMKQIPPPRDKARGLYEVLCRLADELVQTHAGFAAKQFRNAVEQLLETAKVYDSGNPHDTRFLDYLELLSRR